ncbi:MAG: helix-turn-helix transcriptional regulator [Erysipelotrichaceae bacterium]|nr:helix-turn-helix transcriptional regulator [Erysipelotrichaceae bacterium]
MNKQTFGNTIARLRKENGMTQLELAEKMGVTDKAVSKWERDLSYPDINSIAKLAEIFNVSVDELMQTKTDGNRNKVVNQIYAIANLAMKGVALAMGVAVVVLSTMNQLDTDAAIPMLGLGLACLAITQLEKS